MPNELNKIGTNSKECKKFNLVFSGTTITYLSFVSIIDTMKVNIIDYFIFILKQ